jgi:hypothetical protein
MKDINIEIKKILGFILALFFTCIILGCGRYPAVVNSKRDIKNIPANYYSITIEHLPLEDYPLLNKFLKTQEITFISKNAPASDEKIQALAAIPWDKLRGIFLAGSLKVTDVGLSHLLKIKSLKWLQLSQTGVTDNGIIQALGSLNNINSIDISECRYITGLGIIKVSESDSITDIGFSTENLSKEELLSIFKNLKGKSCYIIDKKETGNSEELYNIANKSGFSLFIRRTKEGPIVRPNPRSV